MSFFRLVDEAIRGLVLLVFSFFRTTALLFLHPLNGATRLYLGSRRPDEQHISSLTYLALCMLLSVALISRIVDEGDATNDLSRDLYNGFKQLMGSGGSLAPIGGAFAGTLTLAAIPRLLAWMRGLRDRRRDRFIIGAEYSFGATILLLSLNLTAAFSVLSLTEDYEAPDVIVQVVIQLATVLVYLPGILLLVHFWAALLRNPMPILRLRLYWRHIMSLRRLGFKAWSAENKTFQRRLIGLRADENISRIGFQFRSVRFGMSAFAAMFAPLLLAALALAGGSYAAFWIYEQEQGRIREPLQFLETRCVIDSIHPYAAVAVINTTDKPVAGWLSLLKIRATFDGPHFADQQLLLQWNPKLAGERLTDVIPGGQMVEISGPLTVTRQMQEFARRYGEPSCELAERDVNDILKLLMDEGLLHR